MKEAIETYSLEWFKKQDEPNNSQLDSVGLDELGRPILFKISCMKPDCNCVGSWENGDNSQVHEWIDRPTE